MAPISDNSEPEDEDCQDSDIVYPIMALTLVIFSLVLCALCLARHDFFDLNWAEKDENYPIKTRQRTTKKKLLLMRRRVSLRALNPNKRNALKLYRFR